MSKLSADPNIKPNLPEHPDPIPTRKVPNTPRKLPVPSKEIPSKIPIQNPIEVPIRKPNEF